MKVTFPICSTLPLFGAYMSKSECSKSSCKTSYTSVDSSLFCIHHVAMASQRIQHDIARQTPSSSHDLAPHTRAQPFRPSSQFFEAFVEIVDVPRIPHYPPQSKVDLQSDGRGAGLYPAIANVSNNAVLRYSESHASVMSEQNESVMLDEHRSVCVLKCRRE